MKYTFCTLSNKDYLTRGLTLYRSFEKLDLDFELWILCMDDLTYLILKKMALQKARLVSLSEFEDRALKKAKSNRDFREYCWTCASSFTWYVLKHSPKSPHLAYLDADQYFYSSPEPIYREMGPNSITIIPHWIVPGKRHREKQTGKYNVGMVLFKNDAKGQKCLDWWRRSCLNWCYFRYEDGKFADQKYLDYFQEKFSGVHVLRNRAAGVAPWNLSQYKVLRRHDKIYVNHRPLIFFHFQGLEVYSPAPLLLPAPRSHYLIKPFYRRLFYEPYIQELYSSFEKVKKSFPDFSFGFVRRPGIFQEIFDTIFVRLVSLKQSLLQT